MVSQPRPTLFFKVFLELGIQNLIPYLSFDYNSIKHLLTNKENVQYYDKRYPLFFLSGGRSAIDIALENNLLRSVQIMINYIVTYQNDFVYNNLFIHLFVELMNKGVEVTPLLESNIFNYSFDYDEWPSIHHNTEQMLVPYNQSQFHLMFKYPQLFRKLWLEDQDEEIQKMKGGEQGQGQKKTGEIKRKYKVIYHINILPSVKQDQGSLIDEIAISDELDIFKTDCIQDLLLFKWNAFARSVHIYGFYFHFGYVFMLAMYINNTYQQR